MDENVNEQLTNAAVRLATAAEALETALARIDAQNQELNAKVDRIVATMDDTVAVRLEPGEADDPAETAALKDRVTELERANTELKAQATRATRKTMSPLVTALLAKHDVSDGTEAAALDKALALLSVDQRIAVKAEMARAGFIE